MTTVRSLKPGDRVLGYVVVSNRPSYGSDGEARSSTLVLLCPDGVERTTALSPSRRVEREPRSSK